MALIFIPQYTLDFDTNTGSEISWELDILRSYDDVNPPPSWVNDPVVPLVGTGSPISVTWEKDYDTYKPIVGSSAKINLLVQTANQYADFNKAGPFEYQVRLRYKDAMDSNVEFWCGYITPLDSTEAITTFPFEVSYTATDGLGLLQDKPTGVKTGEAPINPINTVLAGLYETGLDLPVRVDSKIYEGSNDGIISATASANSFYADDKLIKTIPVKEGIEGYLSAFNCKVYQSNAIWYVTNASTHGGSGATETADYQEYVVPSGGTAYTGPTTTSTEELLYTLNGSTVRDLIPTRDNFRLTTRKPLGSVECQPSSLRELELVQNGTFEDVTGTTPALWIPDPASLEQTLVTTTAVRLEGERSITTTQSVKDLGELADIWFTNENGYTVSAASPISVNIDWLGRLIRDDKATGGRNVKLAYQVYFVPDDTFPFSQLNFGTGIPSYSIFQAAVIFYDFVANEWRPQAFAPLSDKKNLTDFYKELTAEGEDDSQWLNENIELRAPNEYYDPQDKSVFPIETGTFHIRFFYPRTNRVRSDIISLRSEFQDAQVGAVAAYVDNIQIKNTFEDDILSPTFERLQLNYNETETYEPRFASGINQLLTQKLNPTDTYFREGKTETVTLERLVTQQKLNDYRGGNTDSTSDSSLRYYTTTVVNNTSVPFSPKNKIGINYQIYDETTSAIFNGGTFNVKENEFDLAVYIPNQSNDIAAGDGTITDGIPSAGFYEENIDLIAQTFQGRSNKSVYTLGISIETTNSADGTAVTNGLIPVTMSGEPYVQLTGVPGETRIVNIPFTPATNFIANTAGCAVTANAEATPRPEFTTFGSFTYNQGDMVLPCEVTFPLDSEYEILYITGSVTPFVPEATPGIVTCSVVVTQGASLISQGALKNPTSTTFNVSGVPGSDVHFTYLAEATSSYELFAANFSINENDTSLVNMDARQAGRTTVAIDFEYNIPTTGESVPVTLNGTGSLPSSADNPAFIFAVDFNTSGNFFSVFETTNNFQGVEGTVVPYDLLISPNEGYDLSATNFSHTTLPTGITERANTTNGFVQNGQEVILPINVTIGNAPDFGTITVTGNAQTEPYSLTFVVNDVGDNTGFTVSTAQKIQPYGVTDFNNSITPDFDFYVTPTTGMVFSATESADSQVEAFIDDEALGLDPNHFLIARTYISDTNDANFGNIRVDVSGNYPNLNTLTEFPQHATIAVNIRGGQTTGGATQGVASGATWAEAALELPGIGNFIGIPNTVVGRALISSDGTWAVKTGAGAIESWITAIQPPTVAEGGVTFFLEELPNGVTTREATFYIYPDAGTATLDTGNTGLGAFTVPNLAGVQVPGSLTITQQDPAVSGLDTTGYSLTGVAVPGGQFLGVATYTDGQGSERIISTSTVQTITFCSNTVPNALAGSVATSALITCSRGTVSGGQTYSDRAGDSTALAGSDGFYVDTAPTTSSADGIYFVRE